MRVQMGRKGGLRSCERGTGGVVTDRARSESSRSGQVLCCPNVAEVSQEALKSAVALVLCLGAEGSEQPAHNEWAASSSLFRKAFSASRTWCV